MSRPMGLRTAVVRRRSAENPIRWVASSQHRWGLRRGRSRVGTAVSPDVAVGSGSTTSPHSRPLAPPGRHGDRQGATARPGPARPGRRPRRNGRRRRFGVTPTTGRPAMGSAGGRWNQSPPRLARPPSASGGGAGLGWGQGALLVHKAVVDSCRRGCAAGHRRRLGWGRASGSLRRQSPGVCGVMALRAVTRSWMETEPLIVRAPPDRDLAGERPRP